MSEYVSENQSINLDNNFNITSYAKFVKKANEIDCDIDPEVFEEALEFQKFAEGKRPIGKCAGCNKKTTRKCKCGCLEFVCRNCSFCLVKT
jgi:hypothetical protein